MAELVLATALWGGTFVVLHDVLVRVDPAALVFARFAVAAPILLMLALSLHGARAFDRAAVVGGVLAGLLGALGFVFQAVGLRQSLPGTSAFLTGLGSLVAGLLAWPLLGQRPGIALLTGIGIAAMGVALMAGPAAVRPGSGEAWTILGALAFGLQIVAIARAAPAAEPLALASVQALTLALAVMPFGWPRRSADLVRGPALARFAYLAIAGSLVAPWLQVRAQRVVSAGRAGLVLALEPVFAIAIAVACGAQRPRAAWWTGAALILLAVMGVELHAARRARAWPRRSTE